MALPALLVLYPYLHGPFSLIFIYPYLHGPLSILSISCPYIHGPLSLIDFIVIPLWPFSALLGLYPYLHGPLSASSISYSYLCVPFKSYWLHSHATMALFSLNRFIPIPSRPFQPYIQIVVVFSTSSVHYSDHHARFSLITSFKFQPSLVYIHTVISPMFIPLSVSSLPISYTYGYQFHIYTIIGFIFIPLLVSYSYHYQFHIHIVIGFISIPLPVSYLYCYQLRIYTITSFTFIPLSLLHSCRHHFHTIVGILYLHHHGISGLISFIFILSWSFWPHQFRFQPSWPFRSYWFRTHTVMVMSILLISIHILS